MDDSPHTHISQILVEAATTEIAYVLARFSTRPEGLTNDDARARRAQYGPNVLARDQRTSLGRLLWHAVLNPLVILLAILASISFATGDPRAGIMMSLMPEMLRGARKRRPVLSVAWLVLVLLAVVQMARLSFFMVDSSHLWGSTVPDPAAASHQCLAAYVHAADLCRRGESNVYDERWYLQRAPRSRNRKRKQQEQ